MMLIFALCIGGNEKFYKKDTNKNKIKKMIPFVWACI